MPTTTKPPEPPRRLITLASGGWVILGSVLIALGILVWQLVIVMQGMDSRAIGDGLDPDTYGFDFSTCLVPREQISASGAPKNRMRVLHDPEVVPASWVEDFNKNERGKFLVPGDLVIGVERGGQARAYPVRMMHWHEIVDDTLGGEPIAITWSPWSGSVVVFDRRQDDEVLDLGFSGLLYNSCQLLYDRRQQSPGVANPESLWSQLDARAIVGPAAAAGRTLRVVPSTLTTWADWQTSYPETTVLSPVAEDTRPYVRRNYKSNPYGPYENDDGKLPHAGHLAAIPPTGEGELPLKTTLLIVTLDDGARRAYPLPWLANEAGPADFWQDELGGQALRFRVTHNPLTAQVVDPSPDLDVRYAYWFAWYALNPESPDRAK